MEFFVVNCFILFFLLEKFIESGDWILEDVIIEIVDEDFDCCDYLFFNIIYLFYFWCKILYYILY